MRRSLFLRMRTWTQRWKARLPRNIGHTGQTCVCTNRVLVQDSVYDVFTEKLVAAVKQLKTPRRAWKRALHRGR